MPFNVNIFQLVSYLPRLKYPGLQPHRPRPTPEGKICERGKKRKKEKNGNEESNAANAVARSSGAKTNL
jgi:hypothetical protein